MCKEACQVREWDGPAVLPPLTALKVRGKGRIQMRKTKPLHLLTFGLPPHGRSRFDPLPTTSGLPRSTDIVRPGRWVRFVQ